MASLDEIYQFFSNESEQMEQSAEKPGAKLAPPMDPALVQAQVDQFMGIVPEVSVLDIEKEFDQSVAMGAGKFSSDDYRRIANMAMLGKINTEYEATQQADSSGEMSPYHQQLLTGWTRMMEQAEQWGREAAESEQAAVSTGVSMDNAIPAELLEQDTEFANVVGNMLNMIPPNDDDSQPRSTTAMPEPDVDKGSTIGPTPEGVNIPATEEEINRGIFEFGPTTRKVPVQTRHGMKYVDEEIDPEQKQSGLEPSYGQVFGQSSRAFLENTKNVINYASAQMAAYSISRQKGMSTEESLELANKIYEAQGSDETAKQEDLAVMLESASPLKRSFSTAIQIIPELGPVDALEALKQVYQSGDVMQTASDYLVQAFRPISEAAFGNPDEFLNDPLAGMIGPMMLLMAGKIGGGKISGKGGKLKTNLAKKLDDDVSGKTPESNNIENRPETKPDIDAGNELPDNKMAENVPEGGTRNNENNPILEQFNAMMAENRTETIGSSKRVVEEKQPWQMTKKEWQQNASKAEIPEFADFEQVVLRLPHEPTGKYTADAIPREISAPKKGSPGISLESDSFNTDFIVYRNKTGEPIGILQISKDKQGNPQSLTTSVMDKHQRQGIGSELHEYAKNNIDGIEKAYGKSGYTEKGALFSHKKQVQQALSDGKSVPKVVLKDYPELQAKNDRRFGQRGLSADQKRQLEKAGVVKPKRVFSGRGKTAIQAVDEAVAKKIIDEGTAKLARHLLEKDPEFDKNSVIEFSDTIKRASQDVIERENLDPNGDYVTVGETISKLEDDVVQTTIKIRQGADADTIVEEWMHRGYNRLSPEDQKLYTDYHKTIKDVRPVDEAFAKDGRDFFFSNKLHEEAGPVGTLFERARDSLKDLLTRIRQIRGTKIPTEITDIYKEIGTGEYKGRGFGQRAAVIEGEVRSNQLRKLAGDRGDKGPAMHDEVVRHREEAVETVELHIVDYELQKNVGPAAARPFKAVFDADLRKDISNIAIHWRDFWRNTEKVFGDRADREVLIPLENAKSRFVEVQEKLITEYDDVIEAKYAIRANSKEDAAVMGFGEWRYTKDDLIKEFGEKRTADIIEAAKWYREKYDMLIDEINEVRAKIYPNRPDKQISKRRDYFRHFQDLDGLGGLANLFDTPAGIPADLAGISEFTKPKSKFISFAQRRLGEKSKQSAAGGYADYIRSATYAITMDPQVANLRAFSADLVKKTGPKKLSAEEVIAVKRQEARRLRISLGERKDGTLVAPKGYGNELSNAVISRVKLIEKYRPGAEGTNNLNNYIKHLDHFINDLAGKSNPADRWFQENFGRKTFGVIDWLNKRVKTNTILGNASSVVAQAFNIPQAIGETKLYSVVGMQDTMAQTFKKWTKRKYPIDQSGFIKERYFNSSYDKFQTSWLLSKVGVNVRPRLKQTAAWYLNAADEISTRFIWNSMYRKAVGTGKRDPIRWSDRMTRDMVAGRGVGEVPIAQKAKVIQIVAPFQLEVGNAWWVLKDQMSQKKFGAIAVSMLTSYIMNRGAEEIRGNAVSFDPIDAIIDGLREFDDPTTDTFEKFLRAGGRVGGEVLSNIPMGQSAAAMYPEYGMTIAGRKMPTRKDLFGSNDPTRYGGGLLVGKGLADPIYKVVAPFGGVQAKKTIEGMGAYAAGEVKSKSGKTTLFKVDQDIENAFKSALFGKWSTDPAREFFEGREEIDRQSRVRKKAIEVWASGDRTKAEKMMDDWDKDNPDHVFTTNMRKQILSDVKKEKKRLKAESK